MTSQSKNLIPSATKYTTAIHDVLNRSRHDHELASPWLRETLESALARAGQTEDGRTIDTLEIARDATRLYALVSDWNLAVSAGELPVPQLSPRRNHYWISVHPLDAEFPDVAQAVLSRDEESNVRSQLMEMRDAGEIENYEVTEYEPDTKGHADVLEWLTGLKPEDSDEDRERCEGCDAVLEAGRIGLCDECMDAAGLDPDHPNTDEHRSGCPPCQKAHDSKLPNALEVQA